MTCSIGMAALAAVSVFVYQNGQVVRSELAHQWTVTATGDWVDGEADDLMTEETMLRDPSTGSGGPGPSTPLDERLGAQDCPCPEPQPIEPLAEPPSEAAPVAVDIPRRQGLTLLELTSRSCRWPIGDSRKADFYFCGAATSEQPYCEVHRVIAYRAPAQR
jgi:GcrA cell cycle regulator